MPLSHACLHAAAAAHAASTATATAPPPPPGPNVLYDSHKVGNRLLDGKQRLASNSSVCQEICRATHGCVCFSHRKSLHHCWLHLQCEHPEHDVLFDSGTATCGERLGGGAK